MTTKSLRILSVFLSIALNYFMRPDEINELRSSIIKYCECNKVVVPEGAAGVSISNHIY
jgi:hypothetical protein